MALDSEVLGFKIFSVRKSFSNKTAVQLLAEYGSLELAQLALAKAEAAEIINHFALFGEVTVAVKTLGTATAQAGEGTGKIK